MPEKPAVSNTRFKLPRHRLFKLLRFIGCEAIALGVLIFIMAFELKDRSGDDSAALLLKILAGISVFAAVAVPVIFYGLPARSRSDG